MAGHCNHRGGCGNCCADIGVGTVGVSGPSEKKSPSPCGDLDLAMEVMGKAVSGWGSSGNEITGTKHRP